jgi:hypothetical protein
LPRRLKLREAMSGRLLWRVSEDFARVFTA